MPLFPVWKCLRAAALAVALCIFSLGHAAAAILISPASCGGGGAGLPYDQILGASGGTGLYTFAVTSGSLPQGLSLASNGTISGTPLSAGLSNFTVTATDSLSVSGSQSYSIVVASASLSLAPSSLPAATIGVAYNQTVSPAGGTPPYTLSLSAGSLPPGLSINGSGNISGTPTTAGSYGFWVAAIDATSVNAGIQFYTLNVGAAGALSATPGTLINGARGTPYTQNLSASGGTGPYAFSLTGGALPAGITLNSSGALSGTPSVTGTYSFAVGLSDAVGDSGSQNFSLTINPMTPAASPGSLPAATRGTAYSQTLTGSGGIAPYSFSLASGALPAGLSLSSGGGISGTPTGSGTSAFTVTIADAGGNSATQAYGITVNNAAVTISPATIPDATRGSAYSQSFSGSGGSAPYTFSLASGAIPTGMSLSSGGVLSGVPSIAGVYAFAVGMTDNSGNSTSRNYSFNVANSSPPLVISPPTLPSPVAGQPYNQTLTGSGGTGPYTFTVTGGALPPGLTLSTSGTLSGTPATSGPTSFTITITDALGNTGTRSFTVNARVNPTLISDMRGMISAQATSARRFAATQIENVSRHLENLHQDFGRCMMSMGIAPMPDAPDPGWRKDDDLVTASVRSLPASPNPVLPRGGADDVNCTGGEMRDLSFWSAGSAQFGSVTASGLTGNRFASSGVTVGMDRRFGDRLIVGVAAGYGASRNDIGLSLSKTDANSRSGVVYASMKAMDPLFISLLMGGGALDYANTRFVSDDGSIALSRRGGNYQFAALIATTKFAQGPFTINPYVRGDYLSVKLGSYSEQGSGSSLLQFGRTEFASKSVVTGLRTSVDIPTRIGVIAPMLRGEYRYSFDDQFRQSVRYADTGFDLSSTFSEPATQRQTFTGGIGFQARVKNGVVEVEYALISQPGSLWARMLRLALRFAW